MGRFTTASRLIAAIVALLAFACGRVGFQSTSAEVRDSGARVDATDSQDSGGMDAADVDAAREPSDGDVAFDAGARAPFGPPVRIEALWDPSCSTGDPTLGPDELEIYFVRRNEVMVAADVYVARRADTASAWGSPERDADLSGSGDDASPSMSRDGRELWLSSIRSGGLGAHDVWVSERADATARWSTPVHVGELSSVANESSPTVDGSGLFGIMAVGMAGARDLFSTRRADRSSRWSPLEARADLNTSSDDSTASIAADGLELYFSSDRPGAMGERDLWVATRADPDSPFGAAELLVELNSTADESNPWVSADGRRIYFDTNRDGVTAIYVASR